MFSIALAISNPKMRLFTTLTRVITTLAAFKPGEVGKCGNVAQSSAVVSWLQGRQARFFPACLAALG